jgi:hypothetical protein
MPIHYNNLLDFQVLTRVITAILHFSENEHFSLAFSVDFDMSYRAPLEYALTFSHFRKPWFSGSLS